MVVKVPKDKFIVASEALNDYFSGRHFSHDGSDLNDRFDGDAPSLSKDTTKSPHTKLSGLLTGDPFSFFD